MTGGQLADALVTSLLCLIVSAVSVAEGIQALRMLLDRDQPDPSWTVLARLGVTLGVVLVAFATSPAPMR